MKTRVNKEDVENTEKNEMVLKIVFKTRQKEKKIYDYWLLSTPLIMLAS